MLLLVKLHAQIEIEYEIGKISSGDIYVFYKKNFYKKMTLKNPQSLEEMLRKSPASNVWFFLELFKSYKIELQSRHFINNHSRDLRASNCSRECQLNRAEPREVKHNS